MKKLELINLKVKKISNVEMKTVNGGFLSIGRACSVENRCTRLVDQSNMWCSDAFLCV